MVLFRSLTIVAPSSEHCHLTAAFADAFPVPITRPIMALNLTQTPLRLDNPACLGNAVLTYPCVVIVSPCPYFGEMFFASICSTLETVGRITAPSMRKFGGAAPLPANRKVLSVLVFHTCHPPITSTIYGWEYHHYIIITHLSLSVNTYIM